jgi:hypothetical protein
MVLMVLTSSYGSLIKQASEFFVVKIKNTVFVKPNATIGKLDANGKLQILKS